MLAVMIALRGEHHVLLLLSVHICILNGAISLHHRVLLLIVAFLSAVVYNYALSLLLLHSRGKVIVRIAHEPI